MSKYLLILRDHENRWANFSEEELEQTIQKFLKWNEDMMAQNQFVGAGKLTADLGKTVKPLNGGLVVDGPYSEVKEAIAGYYIVEAPTIEEAASIAKQCPILTYGGSVEIREFA